MSEQQIQAACVKWLWNNHPETRGLFFAVKNEGAKLSTKVIIAAMLYILKNIVNPIQIREKANEVIALCKTGNPLNGALAKAIGVVPGVSDTIFLWRGTSYLIEFKTQTGKQSDKQKKWQETVEKHGFSYFIVRSEVEFKQVIEDILNN